MEFTAEQKQKIVNYRPSEDTRKLLANTNILLLVAISGGGKDTIKHRLLDTGRYRHIISYTTRDPRTNDGTPEKDGVDYHFIDLATAERMLDEGSFVEADIYADHVYGTGAADIDLAHKENKIAVTDMTIEGAFHYLKLAPSVKAVFLLPPNYDVWMDRLLSRYSGRQNGRDIHLRMQEAAHEIELAIQSDQMYIVVNDDLDEALRVVDDIARGEPVEPHYDKAMKVANTLLDQLREELKKLV